MKQIKYHRVLSFLLTKKTILSYEKFSGKSYQISDSITGSTAWCDFVNQEEWGECTNAFQSNAQAEFLYKHLFNLDIDTIENEYAIKIDTKSVPEKKSKTSQGYKINTKQSIKETLCKKLVKQYPYQKNGYLKKGVLILGIFDPAFAGFKNDIELNKHVLANLKTEMHLMCTSSSFEKIFLVDIMTPFQENHQNYVFELFTSSENINI